jgi:hypothetical protein
MLRKALLTVEWHWVVHFRADPCRLQMRTQGITMR